MNNTTEQTDYDKRLRILNIATDLFVKKGYSGTRMSDIADKLGVTKPIIYKHFRSKDELFEAWMAHSLTAYRDSFISILQDESISVREATKKIIEKSLNDLPSLIYLAPWKIAFAEADYFPTISYSMFDKYIFKIYREFTEAFARGIKNGELIETSPANLSRLFCAPIALFSILKSTFGDQGIVLDTAQKLFIQHYEAFWRAWEKK